MSDEENTTDRPPQEDAPAKSLLDQEPQDTTPDRLTMLKERADLMGIKYHPSIGPDKLQAKIDMKLAGEDPVDEDQAQEEEQATIAAAAEVATGVSFTRHRKPTPAELKMKRKQDALKLVRIRVTCMNAMKGNWQGEIFSVGNAELGMIKKYVPFNAPDGWHVPNIMLGMIRDRKYMVHYETKVDGKKVKRTRLVPEFAVEIMEPLTMKELQELKQRQLMAKGSQE